MAISTNGIDDQELVFGLIGPLGTDLTLVANELGSALSQVNYDHHVYRLSHAMRALPGRPWNRLRTKVPRDEEIARHMDAGNDLRRRLGRQDAMGMLGLLAIRNMRKQVKGDDNESLGRFAHVFHSLKRKEEVAMLRRVYGPAFVALAAYAPRERRVADLALSIARSKLETKATSDHESVAKKLIDRDESEALEGFGQRIEETFPEADIVINAANRQQMKQSLRRAVELLFGNVFHTPSIDEQGMQLAYTAALRSGSLARQVGAAICRNDGSVVALGTNEVPCAEGGQYWPEDPKDARDVQRGFDTSDQMRRNLLADVLRRLQEAHWLARDKQRTAVGDLVDQALKTPRQRPIMKGAQFQSTIDYMRAVHAEMAALTDATRHGVSVAGCTLYCTTFPCHECAKHLVAAGVRRVVYIEPYPKSLVKELFPDSISVDPAEGNGTRVRFEPFVGVAPRRYGELFGLAGRKRKDENGLRAEWRARTALPYFRSIGQDENDLRALLPKLAEQIERREIENLLKRHKLR